MNETFRTELDAIEAGHHRDCDGWLHHDIRARSVHPRMYAPECSLCGDLPGLAGSAETARALAGGHDRVEPCMGECRSWTR